MRILLCSNDAVLLNYVEVLLSDQGIKAVVFDTHISLMEGSIGAFPRRLLVSADAWHRAARVLQDAGLTQWITAGPDG